MAVAKLMISDDLRCRLIMVLVEISTDLNIHTPNQNILYIERSRSIEML
jgi:hypothetical protein